MLGFATSKKMVLLYAADRHRTNNQRAIVEGLSGHPISVLGCLMMGRIKARTLAAIHGTNIYTTD